jgi:hypothetical protein
MKAVPRVILSQLGGNKFLTMTGAKDLVGSDDALWFGVSGRTNGKRINRVRISLMSDDTYSIQCFALRGVDCRLVGWCHDIYAANLGATFERLTGLRISLGRLSR